MLQDSIVPINLAFFALVLRCEAEKLLDLAWLDEWQVRLDELSEETKCAWMNGKVMESASTQKPKCLEVFGLPVLVMAELLAKSTSSVAKFIQCSDTIGRIFLGLLNFLYSIK